MRRFCMALLPDLKKAKRGAIAKAISIMENDPVESRKLVKKIYKSSGKASVIGITGPAGAGVTFRGEFDADAIYYQYAERKDVVSKHY